MQVMDDNWDSQGRVPERFAKFTPAPPVVQPASPAEVVARLKDHQIASLVNDLRDIAVKFHGTQQLREHISHRVLAALRTPTQAPSTEPTDAEIAQGLFGIPASEWAKVEAFEATPPVVQPASPAVEVAKQVLSTDDIDKTVREVYIGEGPRGLMLLCKKLMSAAASSTEPASDPDGARYRKLRGWMSSNVSEGWNEVERMGALVSWESWEAMDAHLDALPDCCVGLMGKTQTSASEQSASEGAAPGPAE